MNDLQYLQEINFGVLFFSIIAILVAIKFIVVLFEWFIDKLGLETKGMRKKRENQELLIKTAQGLTELRNTYEEDKEQSIRHDKMMHDDIKQLMDKVDNVTVRFEEMQKKNNETKLKELKDTLINYYNKYRVVGEWTKLEKDAFWDLFDDYEKRGGNGYIHSIVEPAMRELKEID